MSIFNAIPLTDLFIAVSVAAVVSYRFGWRSTALGILCGTGITLLVTPLLDHDNAGIAAHWLSALLLIGFGIYLLHAFLGGLDLRDDGKPTPRMNSVGWSHRSTFVGLIVAAWATVAQGLTVFDTAGQTGAVAMTLTLGIVALGLVGWVFSGILRRTPAYVADGFAAFIVMAYGACFLAFALNAA